VAEGVGPARQEADRRQPPFRDCGNRRRGRARIFSAKLDPAVNFG